MPLVVVALDEAGRGLRHGELPRLGEQLAHAHPRVAEAAYRQLRELNTNTRFLYEQLVDYAERLTALLPDPLSVCFLVNFGSEANELALRLARTHTGCRGEVVLDGAYHGNTTSLIDLSPHKFDGPGGEGRQDEVQIGFGRVGDHFWAFESQATPDIVTLGKPIGNGYPLGAVVTTTEIAESFANGMEYFNTFGGSRLHRAGRPAPGHRRRPRAVCSSVSFS